MTKDDALIFFELLRNEGRNLIGNKKMEMYRKRDHIARATPNRS